MCTAGDSGLIVSDMDKYTAAARQYILSSFSEHGEPLDSKKLHIHFVNTWLEYRLYEMWIDGRYVDPRFPPLYILVNKDLNVRWMTEDEGDEYQKFLREQEIEAVRRLNASFDYYQGNTIENG